MQFFYQLYYSFAHFVGAPFRAIGDLTDGHPKSRGLVFGLPALFAILLATGSFVFGQFGAKDRTIDRYTAAADKAVEQSQKAMLATTLLQTFGDWKDVPKANAEDVEEFQGLTLKEIEDKEKESLSSADTLIKKLLRLDPSNRDHKFTLANIATRQGEHPLARSLIKQLAPENAPGHEKAQLQMATHLFQLRRYDRAAIHLQNALSANPEFLQAKLLLIQVYASNKKYREATELIDPIFKDNNKAEVVRFPDLATVAYQVYRSMGDEDGANLKLALAMEAFREELARTAPNSEEFNTKLWLAWFRCGIILKRYDQLEAFINKMETLVVDPKKKNILKMMRGDLYTKWAAGLIEVDVWKDPEQNIEKRYELLKNSYKLNPQSAPTKVGMAAIILSGSSKADEALRDYYPVFDDPDPPVGVLELLSTYTMKRHVEALEAGNVPEAERLHDERIGYLRKTLEKNPRATMAANNLAYLLVQKSNKNIDEALRLSRIATSRLPADVKSLPDKEQDTASRLLNTLGTVLLSKAVAMKQNNPQGSRAHYNEALATLLKARSVRENHLPTLQAIAQCYRGLGDQSGLREVEQVIEEVKQNEPGE